MLYVNEEVHMPDKKGFTLMEIIVVMVIIGILAAISVPIYTTIVVQGSAKAAQNNLITIYNAQKNYYFSNGAYCTSANGVCNSLNSINTTLALNLIDNNFTYTCNNAAGFICTATNNSDSRLVLTLSNNPIVLPGGTPPLNPSCATDISTYCP